MRRAVVAGVSPVVWLVLPGILVVWIFTEWEHMVARGREPLVNLSMLRSRQLTGGLSMFFFPYLIQAGAFFTVPLFLSVALGLSALETGVRILPLSVALLVAAVSIRRFRPDANPRRVVRVGPASLLGSVEDALAEAHVGPRATEAIVDENHDARIDALHVALALLAVFPVIAIFFGGPVPAREPARAPT
jgi:hypothetical protein